MMRFIDWLDTGSFRATLALVVMLVTFMGVGWGWGFGYAKKKTEPCLSPTPIAAWNGTLKQTGYLKYMCMWSGERYYCVLEQEDK